MPALLFFFTHEAVRKRYYLSEGSLFFFSNKLSIKVTKLLLKTLKSTFFFHVVWQINLFCLFMVFLFYEYLMISHVFMYMQVCKQIWLGLYDDRNLAIPDFREPQKVKEFLQDKYEKKRWWETTWAEMFWAIMCSQSSLLHSVLLCKVACTLSHLLQINKWAWVILLCENKIWIQTEMQKKGFV